MPQQYLLGWLMLQFLEARPLVASHVLVAHEKAGNYSQAMQTAILRPTRFAAKLGTGQDLKVSLHSSYSMAHSQVMTAVTSWVDLGFIDVEMLWADLCSMLLQALHFRQPQ